MVYSGTANFVSMAKAIEYYGEDVAKAKLAEGAIFIGKPKFVLGEGQTLHIDTKEGRYLIGTKV